MINIVFAYSQFLSVVVLLILTYFLLIAFQSQNRERNSSVQFLLSQSISQDILIGADHEVYRKIEEFFHQSDVVNATLTDSSGVDIVSFTRKKSSLSSSDTLSTGIYFDKDRKNLAANLYVEYRSNVYQYIFYTASVFLLISLIQFLFSTLFLRRKLEETISRPIENLSKIITSDSSKLQKISAILGYQPINEIRTLIESTESAAIEIDELQLELVDKAKFQAIAETTQMLAHDVRKPFSLMKSTIDLISAYDSESEIREILDFAIPEMEKAIIHADGLVQDVMQIGASSQLFLSSSDPMQLIECAVSQVKKLFPDKNIDIYYSFNNRKNILVDKIKIQRVFLNIISNAFQAILSDGDIYISTSDVEEGVKIIIRNTGSYIPKEEASKVFDVFYTKGKKGGTGLGLAISMKIIKDHQGVLNCESDPLQGVSFIFTLPSS